MLLSQTVVMVTACVHVIGGLLAVLVMTSSVTSESSAAEHGGDEAVEALARALQQYGARPAHLPPQLDADWSANNKRESAALHVDYIRLYVVGYNAELDVALLFSSRRSASADKAPCIRIRFRVQIRVWIRTWTLIRTPIRTRTRTQTWSPTRGL